MAPSTVLRALRAGRELSSIKPGKPRVKTPSAATEQIAALAEQGLGGGAIAAQLGFGRKMTVYEIAKRSGIDVCKGQPLSLNTVRDQVQDMKPLEAVEHLLFILEELLGGPDDLLDVMDRLGVDAGTAKVYAALERSVGRVLTYDSLIAAAAMDPANPPNKGRVSVAIVRLRRVLPPGEDIVCVWGFGYRLDRVVA